MDHSRSSMHTPAYMCSYCPQPGDSFSRWQDLVLHEAITHAEIHSRMPCPAVGCTKTYAQLKYLVTHYNIHSGVLTHCPTCQKGYTDPSRASRCRQSHGRHFRCPLPTCDYSNARADLVKQHCKKKHPELGDLMTSQLEHQAYPPPDAQSAPDIVVFPARSRSVGSSEDITAPKLSRQALAHASESRRLQLIEEMRQRHIAISGLSPENFYATLPQYPFNGASRALSQSLNVAALLGGCDGIAESRRSSSSSVSTSCESSCTDYSIPSPAPEMANWIPHRTNSSPGYQMSDCVPPLVQPTSQQRQPSPTTPPSSRPYVAAQTQSAAYFPGSNQPYGTFSQEIQWDPYYSVAEQQGQVAVQAPLGMAYPDTNYSCNPPESQWQNQMSLNEMFTPYSSAPNYPTPPGHSYGPSV